MHLVCTLFMCGDSRDLSIEKIPFVMTSFSGPDLSAPSSRESLGLRLRFLPLPETSRDFREASRCAMSSAIENR